MEPDSAGYRPVDAGASPVLYCTGGTLSGGRLLMCGYLLASTSQLIDLGSRNIGLCAGDTLSVTIALQSQSVTKANIFGGLSWMEQR